METLALVVVAALVVAALVIAGGGMDRTRRRRRTVVVDRPVERVVERPVERVVERPVQRRVVEATRKIAEGIGVRGLLNVQFAIGAGVAVVIGTSGLTADDFAEIDAAAARIRVQGERYPEAMQRMIDR